VATAVAEEAEVAAAEVVAAEVEAEVDAASAAAGAAVRLVSAEISTRRKAVVRP